MGLGGIVKEIETVRDSVNMWIYLCKCSAASVVSYLTKAGRMIVVDAGETVNVICVRPPMLL